MGNTGCGPRLGLHTLRRGLHSVPLRRGTAAEPFAGHLFKQIRKFAALTGLEVIELPPVVLKEKTSDPA